MQPTGNVHGCCPHPCRRDASPAGTVWKWIAFGMLCWLGLASCSERVEREEPVRPVRAMAVGDLAAFSGRQFPGRAEAIQHADLSFRVAGTLMSLPAPVGSEVEEGQVVAQLDPRDFEVRVRGAEAALARATADLARAREEFTRASNAFERGAVSEIEMVRVREAMNIASATADAIGADLQSARDDLADTMLRAPFGGEVASRFVENFEDVQARQRVLRLLNDQRIRFTVFVPESMMAMAIYVEEILCEFDSFPGREIVAEIDEIGREADEVTRTFPITLVMEQPEGMRILSGMSGRAWVSKLAMPDEEADAFDIPPGAIVEEAGGGRHVWIIDGATGIVSKRPVTTGAISPAGVRVRGLERGDIVATAGAGFLREGQRVRLMTDAAAMEGAPE
ncbi:MAG: efflux RND transporter periplasmic adaptor subunit [Phycisphaeraceae bacterium]|nr:MAG: efflux RND transporter periplasmic adaptor subunit [Phycisphaeraceae bacterium]